MPKLVPLTTLLSWVWIALTTEVDNAFEAATSERVGHHFRISLPKWSNGLRFIGEDGVTVDGLRTRARGGYADAVVTARSQTLRRLLHA